MAQFFVCLERKGLLNQQEAGLVLEAAEADSGSEQQVVSTRVDCVLEFIL